VAVSVSYTANAAKAAPLFPCLRANLLLFLFTRLELDNLLTFVVTTGRADLVGTALRVTLGALDQMNWGERQVTTAPIASPLRNLTFW